MDFNELVGDFKLGLFEDLPPNMGYYIRGKGVLARLDRIKNGSTKLNPQNLQVFFNSEEDRKEALSVFSSRHRVQIVDDNRESIQLQSEDYRIRFFRPTIESADKLVQVARLTALSTVIERKQNGEAEIFSFQTTEEDIGNRQIRLSDNPIVKSAYRQIFKLVRAGFEPSDALIEKLPTEDQQETSPTMTWLERQKQSA